MIQVNDVPLNVEDYLSKHPSSIEEEIIQIMSASTKVYSFSSIDELDFELMLRNQIVNASKELNKSAFKFKVFRESICNEKYWKRMWDGGFRLRNDVSAADGISDIFRNGSKYGSECATAMVIVYYKALLNVFAKERFDKMFKEIYLMNWSKIDNILREIGTINKVPEFIPGDRLYFDNPDVNPLTPYLQGENVIYLGKNKYYGHGAGIHGAEAFIKMLNRGRKDGAKKSAYLMDVAGRPNFKKLAKNYYTL